MSTLNCYILIMVLCSKYICFLKLALDYVEVALLCLVSYCILVCAVLRCLWTWTSHGLSLVTLRGGHSSMKQTRFVVFHDFFFKFCCTIWIWEPWFWYWIQFYISSLLETRLPMHLLKVWKWLLVLVRLLSSESLDRPWMLWLPRLKLLLVCILSNTLSP